jgi:hypothetical protein
MALPIITLHLSGCKTYPPHHQEMIVIPSNKFFVDISVVVEGCFLLLYVTLLIEDVTRVNE